MDTFFYIALAYLAVISLVTAAVTAWDKASAIKGRRRTPEKTLFLLAFLGGSLAEYLTMKSIRHKTQHKSFMLGLPAIMLFQLTLLAGLVYHLLSH